MTEWIQYNTQTGIITIDTGSNTDVATRVQRLDSYGSILEKIVPARIGNTQIDASHWPCGTWFIRVEKKQEVQLKRIIIITKLI